MNNGAVVVAEFSEYVTFVEYLGGKLVCGLSDGSVRTEHSTLLGPGAPLVGLTAFLDGFLAGRQDGELVYFDLKAAKQKSFKVPHPLASIACRDSTIAVGTELQRPDAGVLVYKWPSTQPLREYMDAHNDDVTDVRFHPTENVLISGSTDGTVNLYDLTTEDPDEAIYQSVNHNAAIHRADFLAVASPCNKFLALSQMETLSVYQVAHPDENVKEPQPVDFGDVREQWDCEYIADYRDGFLLIGSNNKSTLRLVPFDGQPQLISALNLPGAHGEEVVRCFCIADGKLYTGGEDCKLKEWQLPDTPTAEKPAQAPKKKSSRKHKKTTRANPY